MKIYAIWKPSQLDAILFLNKNDLVDKLLFVIPNKVSQDTGYWLWLRISQDDYYRLRKSEPNMSVID